MVPSHATVQFQFPFLFKVKVQSCHFGGVQSASASSKASAPSAKSLVVHVVGVAHSHDAQFAVKLGSHQSCSVSVFCSVSHVVVGKESLVHSTFDAKVKHRLLFTVIDAAHPCQVAFLVICLDALHNRSGQVLDGSLGVSCHKLLAIHQYLLHLLAVDGYLACVVNLCAGQSSHQFFHHRTLGSAVGGGVIYKGVFFKNHLCRLLGDGGSLKHDGICFHADVAQGGVFITCNI